MTGTKLMEISFPGPASSSALGQPGHALIPQHQHALRETSDTAVQLFDAFDDERSGSAAQHLALAVSVRVGMIPVESGRLVDGNFHAIFESSAVRLNERAQRFILMASGRQVHTVKMQIRRRGRHGTA